uniref:RING-type domain-containing protein n=1 Tax=Noctiluca scintillans TaxID=2966 RepID=A0A7S1FAX9_NOCSC|mmetsp:Transcript_49207/g.130304  ORF Transcript_49207/g.130304 Transcript_49207/m.130304 type:complete len:514 (+) Transcript_49207:78-1619(+)
MGECISVEQEGPLEVSVPTPGKRVLRVTESCGSVASLSPASGPDDISALLRRPSADVSLEELAGSNDLHCSNSVQAFFETEGQADLCVLCLDTLASEPLGVCVNSSGRRTCPHYFHLACLRQVEGCVCPQCRLRFGRRARLPPLREDPIQWMRLVSLSGEDQLSVRDVQAVLNGLLPSTPKQVEAFVSASWSTWTLGEEFLDEARISAFALAIDGALPKVQTTETELPVRLMPTPSGCDSQVCGVHAAATAPGELCSCGRVHVLRGDRVKRNPVWERIVDGGECDFGTVVRCDESAGVVVVLWDHAHEPITYSWPSCRHLHEVVHVPFQEAGSDGFRPVVEASELHDAEPQLFDFVRVLPCASEVQQWFDSRPACGCCDQRCRRNFQWTTNVGRHVGRAGYVLQKDSSDGNVLIEFVGRCHCQLHFPLCAVERMRDQDEGADHPRFALDARVECKLSQKWYSGTVTRLRWREKGWGDRPTAPYIVRLDDGRAVFAPFDSDGCIRFLKKEIHRT